MLVWSVLPGKTAQAYLWISVVLLCHLLASASCQNPYWLNILFSAAAAAAPRSLQSCLTLCNPIDTAHQAPPSLGFSRQEHWSGLPFPSPMHESEKWKRSRLVLSNSLGPHGLQPTRLLRPWDFPGKSTGVGCHCLLHTVFYQALSGVSWALHNWYTVPCLE